MITKKIGEILRKREYISIASCDFKGRPNVAPKFLLKIEDNFIYLVDYVVGRTYENLKVNPQVSLSIMDTEALKGYQINGSVEVIEKGSLYDSILDELKNKEISLATERVIKGVQQGQKHESFELSFPDRIVLFKIKIEEAIEIDSSGKITKRNLKREEMIDFLGRDIIWKLAKNHIDSLKPAVNIFLPKDLPIPSINIIKKMADSVSQINSLEETVNKFSEEQFRQKTEQFKLLIKEKTRPEVSEVERLEKQYDSSESLEEKEQINQEIIRAQENLKAAKRKIIG
jgi:Predicted flavin-nucleotide-binding protein structurally related to pyridoxine 5'-phosphate oxidase